MMGQIFCLFKNSGKNWHVFQVLLEKIDVFIIRFTKPNGTRFQAHVYTAVHNFIQIFLFAENALETNG